MKLRHILSAFLLLCLFSLTACLVPSLQPLYKISDLRFDQTLIGKWMNEEGIIWTFEEVNGTKYRLINTDKSKDVAFEARLVKLGEFLFLDTKREFEKEGNWLEVYHYIPSHVFFRLERPTQDELVIYSLDVEWLKKGIEAHEIKIKHTLTDENQIILNASTEELQNFVLSYATNKEAFKEMARLKREK